MGGSARPPTLGGRLVRRLPFILAVAALIFGWLGLNLTGIYFRDAMAYWRPDFEDLYAGRHVGVMSTYLYSPAFAQVTWPFGFLSWEAFSALWSAMNLGILVWLVGPVVAAILFWIPGPVADEISTGNIHLLLAAVVVIGFRQPGVWAFPLLTKVTPGVGLLWMVGARRWRSLAIALGVTAAIVAVSFLITPAAWTEWVDTLRRSTNIPSEQAAVVPGPLWLRGIIAAVVATFAGVRGWRWLLPVALVIALPVPWSSGLSLLVASLALTRHRWGPAWRGWWWRFTGRDG